MTETLEALQEIGEAFHALGDDVLRHMHPRLHAIRPFGRNAEGKPIVGTPDSYVGPSAPDCTIAVEYTTRAVDRLSAKFVEDYRKVARDCPRAVEVVLCTNRPMTDGVADNVQSLARREGKSVTIIWGTDIAAILDDHRQDLRLKHLSISLGTLTQYSLIGALESQVRRAIAEYLGTDAQALQNRIARRPLEPRFHRVRPLAGLTLLVGDAGQGKSSWSAATALREARASPVVWLPARTVRAAGLNDAIIAAAYGANDPTKVHEIGTLLRSIKQTLLVIVDAIDECADYALLLQHVQDFRARSPLASHTHLVLTCRGEALRTFREMGPGVLPSEVAPDGRSRRLDLEPLREQESEQLLMRWGATPREVAALRQALPVKFYGNPLYLKLARQIQVAGERLPAQAARWVDAFAEHCVNDIVTRLRRSTPGSSPAKQAVCSALGELAWAELQSPGGADPRDVRYAIAALDRDGEAAFVERAVQSGLLQRVDAKFAFCHALLRERFAAAHIVADARMTSKEKVALIGSLPGRGSIATFACEADIALLQHFADDLPALVPDLEEMPVDAAKAPALLARASTLLASVYPSERNAGMRIVGAIRTDAANKVAAAWFNGLDGPRRLELLDDGAELFLALQLVGAIHIVAHHRMLRWPPDSAWYEPEFAGRINRLSPAFRAALADHAAKNLGEPALGESDESRFIMLLAYLGDPRLLDRLRKKVETRSLSAHEHRALIYLNTDDAMATYLASCDHCFAEMNAIDPRVDESGAMRAAVWYKLVPLGADTRRFPHDAMLRVIQGELKSENPQRQNFGLALADRFPHPDLADAYASVVAQQRDKGYWPVRDQMIHELVGDMDADGVVKLYFAVRTTAARRDILAAAGTFPSEQIEELLMAALDDTQLYGAACIGLERLRAVRAGPKLHRCLAQVTGNYRYLTVKALGRIRYVPALDDLLAALKRSPTDGNLQDALIDAIGLIGSQRAYDALAQRYREQPNVAILSVLIDAPGNYPRTTIHELLEEFPGVASDLGSAIRHRDSLHDDTILFSHPECVRPEFHDDKILKALLQSAAARLQEALHAERHDLGFWYDYQAVALFDSPLATAFFEDLARREPPSAPAAANDTVEAAIRFARRLLAHRGDGSWARVVVDEELDRIGDRSWTSSRDIDELGRWPAKIVRAALLERAKTAPQKWLIVLASFSTKEDDAFIRERLSHVGPELADAIRQSLPA